MVAVRITTQIIVCENMPNQMGGPKGSEILAGGRRYGAQTAAERHAARRSRLLEAALELFGTRGYQDTAIGQLCAVASVSTRSFYELFPSREALLIGLHDAINAEALVAVGEALADLDPNDLPSRARAGVAAYLRTMTSDRRRARIALIESVGVSRETEAHRQEAIGRFAAVIQLEGERLAAAGVVPARDFRLVAVALVGAINGLVNTWTADPDWDAHTDTIVEVAADLIVGAVGGPR
jgi:AcrR family transcriptional regulator